MATYAQPQMYTKSPSAVRRVGSYILSAARFAKDTVLSVAYGFVGSEPKDARDSVSKRQYLVSTMRAWNNYLAQDKPCLMRERTKPSYSVERHIAAVPPRATTKPVTLAELVAAMPPAERSGSVEGLTELVAAMPSQALSYEPAAGLAELVATMPTQAEAFASKDLSGAVQAYLASNKTVKQILADQHVTRKELYAALPQVAPRRAELRAQKQKQDIQYRRDAVHMLYTALQTDGAQRDHFFTILNKNQAEQLKKEDPRYEKQLRSYIADILGYSVRTIGRDLEPKLQLVKFREAA
jgi:hypothetical protein